SWESRGALESANLLQAPAQEHQSNARYYGQGAQQHPSCLTLGNRTRKKIPGKWNCRGGRDQTRPKVVSLAKDRPSAPVKFTPARQRGIGIVGHQRNACFVIRW